MEGYNSGSNKTTITFIVLVLFIVAGAFIVMNRDMFSNNIDKEEEKEVVEKNTTKIDSTLKKQLKNKLAVLMMDFNSSYTDGIHGGYGFHTVLFKRELTDVEKQAYILTSTNFEPLTLDYKKIPEIDKMISNDSSSKSEFKEISSKVIDEKYKKFFNDSITERATEVGHCPPIHYYADIDTYVSFPARCGGATDQFFITYLDEMKRNDDTIEIYMYLANGKEDKVYADFDLASKEQAAQAEDAYAIVPKKEVEVKEHDVNGRPTINNYNKKDFSKYKFTFKNAGEEEFYFVSVEQEK